MNWSLLLVPGTALGRSLLGWLENALADGYVDLPEWRKLGETIIRMGTPMVALIWGLKFNPAVAASLVTVFDIVLTKVHSALKN